MSPVRPITLAPASNEVVMAEEAGEKSDDGDDVHDGVGDEEEMIVAAFEGDSDLDEVLCEAGEPEVEEEAQSHGSAVLIRIRFNSVNSNT